MQTKLRTSGVTKASLCLVIEPADWSKEYTVTLSLPTSPTKSHEPVESNRAECV
jgi:hypothetical protein